MKKFTSIAAALCLATAFSGFCAGCASSVTNSKEDAPKNTAVAADSGVSVAAAGDKTIVLCPGWNYNGNTKALNTLTGTGVTKMTQAQAEDATNKYWVENAYIFEAAAGTDLPSPTAGKSGLEFVGWRESVGGIPTIVTKMPDGNTTKILYAEWKVTGSGNSQGGGGGQGNTNPSVPANAGKAVVTFADGSVNIYLKLGDNFVTAANMGSYKLYMWTSDGDTNYFGGWPGKAMSATMSVSNSAAANASGASVIVNWSGGQTDDLTGLSAGGSYVITLVDGAGSISAI